MNRLLAATAVLLGALTAPARAQPATPLFAADTPLQLTITAPLKTLIGNRESEQIVTGTLTGPDGHALPINVKLRGITRRTEEVCAVSAAAHRFSPDRLRRSLFAGQKQLKLVTHCRNSAGFQQYLLLEYAAYRMYNLLSPRSFRVRLAQIDYRRRRGTIARFEESAFSSRICATSRSATGCAERRAGERIPVAELSTPGRRALRLFQYMITNLDWSMRAGPPGDALLPQCAS